MELESEIIRPGENSYLKENPNDESDLPPEFCHYPDEGCEFAQACLDCPFPQCIYDEPGGRQHFVKDLRRAEIAATSGAIRIPPNCGQQLYDVVDITDPQAGLSSVKKRVMGIILTYNPLRGEYEEQLLLGTL